MPSTYTVNLGIEKVPTGEQSGTWGETTNLNFDIIDQAINGIEQITLSSAGNSGSPNSLAITDGALSDGRNKFIEFIDGSDLGATAYVQLTPSNSEKIVHIRNSLSGSQSLIVFQGTYSASNDYEIANGKDVYLRFDGAGSGAVVTEVMPNEVRTGSFQLDNLKLDGNTLSSTNTNGNITLSPNGTGAVAIGNAAITGGSVTGITDMAVADGGTGASTASGARTNLGLAIGSDVQAYDAQLADIAGLTPTDSYFIVGNGANFVTETGSTARSSLGLGSIATQASSSVSITGGSMSGVSLSSCSGNISQFTNNSGYTTNSGTVTSVATGTGLTGGTITTSGTLSLATAGAGAATYSSGISAITVDAYGRVTSVSGSAGYSTTSGTVTSVATGNGLTGGTITSTGTLSMSGSYTGTFAVSGAITATGDITAYYSSDERLKDNKKVIKNSLDKVHQMSGYEFDWNDKQDLHTGHDIGVIAQEVEKVLPEIVTTRDNGYKAVKYEKLVAVLIEAVKELSDKLDKKQCKCSE